MNNNGLKFLKSNYTNSLKIKEEIAPKPFIYMAKDGIKISKLNKEVIYAARGIKLGSYTEYKAPEQANASSLFDMDYGDKFEFKTQDNTSETSPEDTNVEVFDLSTLTSSGSSNKKSSENTDTKIKPESLVTTTVTSSTAGSPRTPELMSSDIEKSIQYIKNNATSSYSKELNGYCGRAVGNALISGGFNVTKANGNDYHDRGILSNGGFEEVYTGNGANESAWSDKYIPQAGDVVVLEKSDGHNYGHVAMYTGDGWYSDFKQGSFHGYADPTKVSKYHIYRKKQS